MIYLPLALSFHKKQQILRCQSKRDKGNNHFFFGEERRMTSNASADVHNSMTVHVVSSTVVTSAESTDGIFEP